MFMAFPQQNWRIISSINTQLFLHITHIHAVATLFFSKFKNKRLVVVAVACSQNRMRNSSEIKYLSECMILIFDSWTFSAEDSADQQHCTGLLIAVHYMQHYIYVDRSAEMPVKIMLVLRKFCDNFGLREQHLGCHNGCGLMTVNIHCRTLGTAIC